MSAVSLDAVVKRYPGGPTAVDGVSFEVQAQEIVALVGESGCGKSTLLRLIAGLEEPDGGSISLFGAHVADPKASVPPEHRGVAMVFQDHALFPHLRVRDNVGFGLQREAASTRRARTDEALELVGLPDLGERFIHELSGGQRQRVALARALAPQPRLLLLDEPLSSLDERLHASLRDDIASLLRARQTTAIWVTHTAEDAMAVADRVASMQHGQILQSGSPEDLYRNPTSTYTARLFGEVNTLDAQLQACIFGQQPDSPGPWLVRPEALTIALGGPGVVVARQLCGHHYVVSVQLDGTVVKVSARPDALPELGAQVSVSRA